MDKVHGIKKSPLQMVKEKFESKEKLAEKIVELLAKSKEEKQQLKETLLVASNKQLLRLFDIGNSMKSRFGSKEKIIETILTIQNRVKDLPYKEKLQSFSIPKLMDLVSSFEAKSRKGDFDKKEKDTKE